jgi:uncharacterized metal-binding protein YceD (DUF177 family)
MTPEFSRRIALDRAQGAQRIAADEAERAALARRFRLVRIDSLDAEAELDRDGADVTVTGRVIARAVQSCVATDAELPVEIDEPFALRFIPANAEHPGEEIELEPGACDTIEHVGLAIDLGEAAAQTLALALDPFPRAPDADQALKAAGVLSEGETGPFAALRGMLEKE